MSVKHNTASVGNVATSLTAFATDNSRGDADGETTSRVVITNESATDPIYLGGPGVTAGDYGKKLAGGASITLDLMISDEVFAIGPATPVTVRVMLLGV